MAAERKFEDARKFDIDDEVRFKYDDPIEGDNNVHVGTVVAVQNDEDDQQIKHKFRYIVQFKDVRDKEGLRQVQCIGTELTLI